MSKHLTPEQQRLILQAGLELLVDDALMGYTDFYLGGGSATYWFNGTGLWIDVTGNHPWHTEGLPFVTWKAIKDHGDRYPDERAELRQLRSRLVDLQSAIPSWPWGAPPEEIAAHEQAQHENWAEQDHVRRQMKGLVRTILAAGDPDQPIDLLEAAGLPAEPITAPSKRHARHHQPAARPDPGQALLF